MKKMVVLFLFTLFLAGCLRIEERVYYTELPAEDFDLQAYLEENHPILGVTFQVEKYRYDSYDLILIPQDEEWDLRFHYQVTHDEQQEYANLVQRGIYAIIDDVGTETIRTVRWQRLNDEASIELFPRPERFSIEQAPVPSAPAPSTPAPTPSPAPGTPAPSPAPEVPSLAEPTDLLAYLNANFPIQGVNFDIYDVRYNEGIGRYQYTLLFVPQDEEWDYRFQSQMQDLEYREYFYKVLEGADQIIAEVPQNLSDTHIHSIQWQPLDSDRELIMLVQDRGLDTLR